MALEAVVERSGVESLIAPLNKVPERPEVTIPMELTNASVDPGTKTRWVPCLLSNESVIPSGPGTNPAASGIGIPHRSMHTQAEECRLGDLGRTVDLVVKLLSAIDSANSLRPSKVGSRPRSYPSCLQWSSVPQ